MSRVEGNTVVSMYNIR